MAGGATGKVGFRPLYQQVQEAITGQVAAGRWPPGAMLPSEIELARELGVSQGTVRKALDAMTADRILVRRQGRGTFVAEYEESRILFQFFRLYPDSGARLFPESRVLRVGTATAAPEEAAWLGLPGGTPVWRIERLRMHAEKLLLSETLALPLVLFPGLGEGKLPNNLYQFYAERWAVTVARISEKLKAVAADATDAARLQIAPGTPLLEVRRVAFDLKKRAVEYRRSRCLTAHMHYASDLG